MQEFTRNISREVTIGSERIALNLSSEGVSLRPVGTRKPPIELSWPSLLCFAVGLPLAGQEPTEGEIREALERLRDRRVVGKSASVQILEAGSSPVLEGVLNRIQAWLDHNRPRFARGLKPGATDSQLDSAQLILGKKIPPELRQLLAWHNGQDEKLVGTFERSFHLVSLDEMVSLTQELEKSPPPGWNSDWLPFLASHSDSYVIVACDKIGCPVHEVWNGKSDHPQVAPTLVKWLDQFSETLWGNGYVEDPERGDLLRKS